MSEHTPHDSEGTSADPWAEATDEVRPGQGAATPAEADADQRSEKAARSGEKAARSGEKAARSGEKAARVADEAARTADQMGRKAGEAARSVGEARSGGDAARAAAGGGTSVTPEGSVRAILAEVAAGKLTPEQAAPLIDAAREPGDAATATGDAGATEATDAGREDAGETAVPVAATITRLRVRAVGRRVRIIGEPFVSTVAVDGPHVVRQEGDTLVVTSEGEFGASIDGFTLMRSRNLRDVQERVFDIGRELSVRVNPSMTVEVEVTAGSVNAERLPGLEQVRVTAGSARVRDVDGPIDLLVQAGSAQVEGKITKGRSRLRAESGSLQLRLLPGSSVRVRPDVQLGRVQWEPPGKDREEHIVGLGDAVLNLEVVMGTATVKEAP
ncbi:hypothetical protein ABN034_05355 [Actinopolymorpha sp. B11F2]|uniref:hypothetical protein n=1 Tax=Actinopolymorpha sp. B11F2 TaxID=3160862 RepID=UPI0032E386B7